MEEIRSLYKQMMNAHINFYWEIKVKLVEAICKELGYSYTVQNMQEIQLPAGFYSVIVDLAEKAYNLKEEK